PSTADGYRVGCWAPHPQRVQSQCAKGWVRPGRSSLVEKICDLSFHSTASSNQAFVPSSAANRQDDDQNDRARRPEQAVNTLKRRAANLSRFRWSALSR